MSLFDALRIANGGVIVINSCAQCVMHRKWRDDRDELMHSKIAASEGTL